MRVKAVFAFRTTVSDMGLISHGFNQWITVFIFLIFLYKLPESICVIVPDWWLQLNIPVKCILKSKKGFHFDTIHHGVRLCCIFSCKNTTFRNIVVIIYILVNKYKVLIKHNCLQLKTVTWTIIFNDEMKEVSTKGCSVYMCSFKTNLVI